MNTVIAIASTALCMRVDASWLLVSLARSVAQAAMLPLENGERGMISVILAVLAVIILNILMLAFALRLRRYFHSLGEHNEEE